MTCFRGRSGSPFCTCCFSSVVGLKCWACQGAYLGVVYPESLYYKHLEKNLAISCWGKNFPSLNLGIPLSSPRDKGSHLGKHKYVSLYCKFKIYHGEFLVIQWLRLRLPNAGGLGLIPEQGTRSYMPQLKSPYAAIKTRRSQIHFSKKFYGHFQTYIIK